MWKVPCSLVLRFWPCVWPVRTVKRLQNKILFHRFFHRLWLCEKCPVHRFWDFRPCEKTCEKAPEQDSFSQVFHRIFHRFYFTGFLTGFFTGFDPVKSALFTGFQNFTSCEKPVKNLWKNTWKLVFHSFFHRKIHRFFTGFSRVLIQ